MLLRARRESSRWLTIGLESRLIVKLHMVDEDFAWRLAQELVKIDSSDPGAYELEIEQHIKDLVETYVAKLDSPVLDTAEIRELEVFPGRCNLMITVPGASGEARLVYICHMDTVTLGDGWNADTTVGFFTGCTDTAVIAGKPGNRNCMSYGPGSLVLAHKPNEPGPMPISFAARTYSSRLLTTRSGTQASKLGHNKPRTNRLAR